jgi:hypothetical protein
MPRAATAAGKEQQAKAHPDSGRSGQAETVRLLESVSQRGVLNAHHFASCTSCSLLTASKSFSVHRLPFTIHCLPASSFARYLTTLVCTGYFREAETGAFTGLGAKI